MSIKYPQVNVSIIGEDGNAFFILGRVQMAMKKAHIPNEDISLFIAEATSSDYDHLLQTVIATVSTDEEEDVGGWHEDDRDKEYCEKLSQEN